MKLLFLIAAVLISSGCATGDLANKAANENSQPSPSATPTATPAAEKIDTSLQTELAKIAEAAKGRVGVGVVLVETGQAAYLDRAGRYPMQSVYKLPIAMAVLQMVDEGKTRIDQEVSITPDYLVRQGFHSPIRNANPQGTVMPVGEIIRYSVSESDGTASDVLLDLAGGSQALMSYLMGIGISDLIIADSEKSISKDWKRSIGIGLHRKLRFSC